MDQAELDKLLRGMAKHDATDLHLKVGAPPFMRIAAKIRTLELPPLSPGEIDAAIRPYLGSAQRAVLDAGQDLDMALSIEEVGRFRINIFRERGALAVAIRRVRTAVPTFEDLHLPADVLCQVAAARSGLVLVCGPSGSGKSTTLAAFVEHLNRTRRCHIVTIEDPIEYLYRDDKALIVQREVGIDVEDFKTALKHVVRQDPDVILIGEMRDRETFEAGLAAASTGHLVFGTVHSPTVAATVGRILEFFPSEREKQIRQALRLNLRAIVCQRIVPSIRKGVPLVPAVEILVNTPVVAKVIGDGEDEKLEAIARAGADGMVDFDTSLVRLVNEGAIAEKTAIEASANPEQLRMNLKGIVLAHERGIMGA